MKTTLKNIVEAYNLLGTAKTSKLEASEVISIVRVRKTLRGHVEAYNEFAKELHEKFKTEHLEKLIEKIQKQKPLTTEEQEEYISYNTPMNEGLNKELLQEIELTDLPKVSEESLAKLSQENDWEMRVFELLEFMV